MVITIIGAGALGKLYGGLLALSGHAVHFLARSEYDLLNKQKSFELYFKEHDTSYHVENLNLHQKAQTLPKADLAIVTLKTTDNDQLPHLLKDALKDDTAILVIQNGIGNEESIHEFFPSHTIISAISTAAATRAPQAKVDVFFLGALRVAAFGNSRFLDLKDIQPLFTTEIKPAVEIYDNYKDMRWHKLIWNIPFCGLSIVYNQSCDILASTKPYVNSALGIMSEVQDIAKSEGVTITDSYIRKMVDVTCKVKDYYPSMYWDYVHHKPIEKEFIMENPIKIAQKNHVPTPMMNLILKKLDELSV